jgi:mono/diheme cytochrome c family protein
MTSRIAVMLVCCIACTRAFCAETAATYAEVHAIFAKHCLACHDSEEAEGGLVLETREMILAGGDSGEAVVPGKAAESLLVRLVERREKPFMPPPKKAAKLSDGEIKEIRAWIDSGAPGPKPGEIAVATSQPVTAPRVAPKGTPRQAVQAMAYTAKGDWLAVARSNAVELWTAKTQARVKTLSGHQGNVNEVAFTADGTKLAAAAGQPGKRGEVQLWNVADGILLHTFEGHTDAIYSVAISPDGKTLATGSYDQRIILWDLEGRKKRLELEGHNGAVFALAFRNDGKVLASASADRTIKLWDVSSGKRLDTRSEALKDQLTLGFTPDGQRLLAAGADNRVRVWSVSPSAVEGTNPLLDAHFAHEGAVLRLAISADGHTLATSADDRTVKLRDLADFRQKLALPAQPDWPSALAFLGQDKQLAVGRLDGSVSVYDVASGKVIPPTTQPATKKLPPKTTLAGLEPRGIQRGQTVRVRLLGKDGADVASAKTNSAKVTVKIVPTGAGKTAEVDVTAAADAPLGAFDLSVTGSSGESQSQKFVVDDLPQVETKAQQNLSISRAMMATTLPVTFGGKFGMRGEADYFGFDGRAGQKLVVDVAARRVGSKAAVAMGLLDSAGRTIATGEDVDGDPILETALPADGRYFVRVAEQGGNASEEHFYRASVGDLHVVTGVFPIAAPPKKTVRARLLGFNLPQGAAEVSVQMPESGEAPVPVDAKLYRVRRQPTVLVGYGEDGEQIEREPNDAPAEPNVLFVPGAANGWIAEPHDGKPDVDLYRFAAKKGRTLVIETMAARRSSPADTRVEVLWPDGKPVQRVQLQAVRDSYLNFRGTDANQTGTRLQNWEEMDLDQYVYLNGEVVRLFRMPQGPDSDLLFYALNGKRRGYFDTTATAHALEDKVYIVEPHPPGDKLSANGLPVFPIYYANDDDERRELGSDSRLLFTAPADGQYLVRVSDVRSYGGERYVYRLTVREAAPDFAVSIQGANLSVPPGSGRNFTVSVNRIDGYEGPVRVEFTDVPPGFSISNPIVVQAGHTEAKGAIFASKDGHTPNAKAPPVKYVATAEVGGNTITKATAELGRPKVEGSPQLFVQLKPYVEGDAATPTTIELVPGQLTKAWLRVQRNGHKAQVTFDVENLPHGVIVADIGLNGVLIPADQTERQIFLQCAPWVKETVRPCHARANEAGNPTSAPVIVHVRPTGEGQVRR